MCSYFFVNSTQLACSITETRMSSKSSIVNEFYGVKFAFVHMERRSYMISIKYIILSKPCSGSIVLLCMTMVRKRRENMAFEILKRFEEIFYA